MIKDSRNLPISYNVGGQLIRVEEIEQLPEFKLGECCVAGGYLKVASMYGQNSYQSIECKYNTFIHEIVHTILDTMGEHNLSSNEKFVNSFSSFLTEVLTTMKYKENE